MNVAPSIRSLLGFNGLMDYPALKGRSDAAHDQEAQDIRDDNMAGMARGEIDPFFTMKLDQTQQAKVSPWSPFYQALGEANNGTLPRVRFEGYNPKAAAASEAPHVASALNQMGPFKPTPESYPLSVRQLFTGGKGY